MLDIRATHYVSPLTEVDFASVELTVHLVNLADETGLVTGKFRVYNDTTGLLIHTSDIAPTSLPAGAGADVTALTDFDPPAPLDDTYFVIFDATAVNQLVPNTIPISLGAFHFDVKPTGMGPAPAAHGSTHELGGSDELDVTGLPGAGGGGGTPSTFELFTASGTWTKPAGAKLVYVEAVGGGGAGSGAHGNAAGTGRGGGTGGGGGAFTWKHFPADALSATVVVTVGEGATGTAGGTNADGVDASTPGGNSTFGAYLTAFGGCGGKRGRSGSASEGGGGGGSGGPGVFAGAGGPPGAATNTAIGGQGAQGNYNAAGGCSEFGGAGGAGNTSITLIFDGGSSIYGPGGGASGGYVTSGNVEGAGKVGGATKSYTAGGGGSAGSVNGGAGGDGTAGDGRSSSGAGGGGGGGNDDAVGGAGGNGGAPGGGGGGGGGGTTTGGAGGNGARGEVRVWVWF